MYKQGRTINTNLTPKTHRIFCFNMAIIVLLLLALVLSFTMAVTSDYDSHPDEKVHFEAVKHYNSNWIPPAVGDPDTLGSYSVYGHSRLNELGFYYFLAGKFAAILTPFTGNLLLSARLFNILLFLILIISCIRAVNHKKLLYCVLLLTPQVWYIFTYVNSDAFALFLTMMITGQLIFDDSLLMRYFNSTANIRTLYQCLPLVLMVLCLYFAKANFYIYFIFLAVWGVWFLYSRKVRKQLIVKCLLMITIFLILVAARHGLDYSLYGPNKNSALEELREIVAVDEYKPSARSIGEGHPEPEPER